MSDFFDLDSIDTPATPEEMGMEGASKPKRSSGAPKSAEAAFAAMDEAVANEVVGDDEKDQELDIDSGDEQDEELEEEQNDEDVDGDEESEEGDEDEEAAEAARVAEEAAAAAKAAKKPKQTSVPFDRFKEINDERKALKEELAALRSAEQSKSAPAKKEEGPAYDFTAKQKEAGTHLWEGRIEEYTVLQEEINAERMRIAEEKAEERASKKYEERLAQQTAKQTEALVNKTVSDVIAKYPYLDDDSATRDADAIDYVQWRRDKLIASGVAPHEAIAQAADAYASIAAAKTSKPAAAAKPDRASESLKRAVDASNKQPPRANTAGVGSRSQKPAVDPAKMSQVDWGKLSAAQRDKLLANL